MDTCGCFGSSQLKYRFKKHKNIDHLLDYQTKRKNLKLPKNVNAYFELLEETSKNGYKKAIKKIGQQSSALTENFYKNFDNLPKYQQNIYLYELITEVDRRIRQKQQTLVQKTITIDTEEQINVFGNENQCIQTKCKYCSGSSMILGLIKNWQQVILKFNKTKKKLTIKYSNNLFHIRLRSYTLRIEKDDLCLVLDSMHQFQQKNVQNLEFKFKDKEKFQTIANGILQVIVAYQIDKLMMENMFNRKFQKFQDQKINRINLYLTPAVVKKCINKIFIYNRQAENEKKGQSVLVDQSMPSGQSIKITQYRNSQGQWFKGQIRIKDYHEPKTINFLEVYQHSHKYLTKLNILQTLNADLIEENSFDGNRQIQNQMKYCAFYQKLKVGNQIYGQEVFLQKQRKNVQNQQIFNFVNLDHELNNNFIEFLKIKLSPDANQQNSHFVIDIVMKVNLKGMKLDKDKVVDFLGEFYYMFERLRMKVPENKTDEQLGLKELNSKFYISKDLISRFGAEDEHQLDIPKKNFDHSKFSYLMKRSSVENVPMNAFLRKKHNLEPSDRKIGKIMKDHFLYKEWERLPQGGLKCTNYQLVAFQKSLYKTVMKKFGENLLKGKNIINFSLPVVCFKKQSHLQSLAQSMCYCPIYLQQAAKIKDPFERMKYSAIIMIAVGILTVQSQKPFNPILGETYQGYVDGCPVYLEQISHHPPISAYYMVGRGYKIYGCVQPRITLGFNSATGYSNLPHYIEFDDGTKIELIFAKITITGMLIGDREFFFEDKIYAYDEKNNLFTELIFGPINNGFFSSSSQPQDYFHGKIYSVNERFKEKFKKSTPRIYPTKQDIVRENLMFDGIWSGSIHMDGEEIINFKTDLPYEFVQEEYPIMSDSRYRKDLQTLRSGDKEEAQRYKQELEELQRNDKKLRQKQGQGS